MSHTSVSSSVNFYKMHGLGNDFMVIDAVRQQVQLTSDLVKTWADRHRGVGFDQLLVVEPSQQKHVDFRYRIFNADGSEVAQCGNGARCFAQFVRETGLSEKSVLHVETKSGVIVLYHKDQGISVNMGQARFEPQALPLGLSQTERYQLEQDGETIPFGAVSMGNPHAVILSDDLVHASVERIGKLFQQNASVFPESVNVGFAQVINRQRILLRVYERGAGETQACGTGACAAMAVCRAWGLVDDHVTVVLPGGDLHIAWTGAEKDSVWMTGPAVTVFKGSIEL